MDAKQRHDLKRDEFTETVLTLADRVAAKRRALVTAAVVLLGVLVVVGGIMTWRTRQANEAGALLGIALATAESPIVPPPSVAGAMQTPGTFPTVEARAEAAIAAFNAVIERYPGTEAARTAAFHLASELLAAGRAEEAERAFAAIAAEEGNTLRGGSARLGQAEALLALGRADEALAIYNELAAARDGVLPQDAVLMELARASERAGRVDDARAAYRRVIDEYPQSLFVMQAEQQLAALN